MPFLKENPDWYFLEITDGFGAHHNNVEALQLRLDANCLALKEEGDSSHVNQAYDRFVAKGDKRHATDSLSFLRGLRYKTGQVLDQYSLVHVVLDCVRQTKRKTWTNSFRACNLDPRTRLPFKQWCDKISPFLLAGETFKEDGEIDAEYIFDMMPVFWKGMTVEERKKMYEIFYNEEGDVTQEMLERLHEELNVPYKDMHQIRVIECCTDYEGLMDIQKKTCSKERCGAR